MRSIRSLLIPLALLPALCVPVLASADDTEVFFSRAADGRGDAANVLFMFDISASMGSYDDTPYRRITRLKQAMLEILEDSEGVNIGIGSFNGSFRGGAILYPASDPDGDACPNAGCDEIELRVPVRHSSDDAEQAPGGDVTTSQVGLDMTSVVAAGDVVERTYSLGSAEDNAVELDGALVADPLALPLFFVPDSGGAASVGLRFPDVDIPAGATVLSAQVELRTVPDAGEGGQSATISMDGASGSPPFADADGLRVTDRPRVGTSLEWKNIPIRNGDEEAVRTVDLSALVAARIARPDWTSGDALALLFELSGSQAPNEGNRRAFKSFGFGTAPVLKVSYTTSAPGTNRVGIRFADVAVPRGATITYAAIEFNPRAGDSAVSAIEIRAEDIGHAPTFVDVANDIGRRTPTTASVTWEPGPWQSDDREEPTSDLAAVVQEVVGRGDWCGGNALAFLLGGEGYRIARSHDSDPENAPVLRVGYRPDSIDFATTCTSERTLARVEGPGDDGEEHEVSGANDLGTAALDAARDADGRTLGLRFANVDVPRDAAISSAYLKLSSAGSDGDATLAIRVAHKNPEVGAFDGTDGDIGERETLGGTATWTVPEALPGERLSSVDIGPLVERALDHGGWSAGDALVVTLEQVGGAGHRRFDAFESGAGAAARLEINRHVEGASVGGATRTLRTARDEMIEIVSGFRHRGATPLVDAYYESAAYLLGEPVDYGLVRGDATARDRFSRTSTPLSWTGGALYTPPDCSAVDPNAVACLGERVPDGAVYDAPSSGSCQANQIVLLSDGQATAGDSRERIRSLTGASDCDDRANDREECAIELAGWLKDGDPSTDRAPILTHTVGFNFSSDFLREVATAGGGRFQEASSASELAGVFKRIVDDAAPLDTTFVAPSATVSQFNRLANRNDIYFSMFRPGLTTRWAGNLKRYELDIPPGEDEVRIVDALGNAAIDDATGDFRDGARSFWTDGAADGADVARGGAANELALPRTLYTYAGAPVGPAALTDFHEDNAAIDAAALGIDPTDADYRSALLEWSRGVDVLDVDGDGDTTEVRREIGDPMHSSPFLLNYPGENAGDDARSRVFVGTNEGFLHAIDTDDGGEAFGFIPPELFANLDHFFRDRVVRRDGGTHDRPYGLDGEVTGWHDDTDRDGLVDAGEKAYVYVGMRRGGRNYYALDVSDPAAPSLAWVVRGGSGDFAELGQSWSTPVHTRMRDGSAVRDVLVFGAGYDTGGDTRTAREAAAADGVGRGLFVVDARTGVRLADVGPSFHNDMDYSIPSTVSVVDIDLDGLADMFWVGDTGARVWRFDIETGGDAAIGARIDGSVAADLGSVGSIAGRRFHYPPDVTLVQDDEGDVFLNVGIGSGWRAHPLDTTVEDRFYMLRTADIFGPPRDEDGNVDYPEPATESTLFDATRATTRTAAASALERGWYIGFPADGEKVLGAALTVEGQVLFTSYVPDDDAADVCSVAVGGGRLYALDAITAEAVLDLDGSLAEDDEEELTLDDRSRRLRAPGIPAPVSVLLPESANPSGSDEVTLDVRTKGERIEIDSLPTVTRTYWAEHGEEN